MKNSIQWIVTVLVVLALIAIGVIVFSKKETSIPFTPASGPVVDTPVNIPVTPCTDNKCD